MPQSHRGTDKESYIDDCQFKRLKKWWEAIFLSKKIAIEETLPLILLRAKHWSRASCRKERFPPMKNFYGIRSEAQISKVCLTSPIILVENTLLRFIVIGITDSKMPRSPKTCVSSTTLLKRVTEKYDGRSHKAPTWLPPRIWREEGNITVPVQKAVTFNA